MGEPTSIRRILVSFFTTLGISILIVLASVVAWIAWELQQGFLYQGKYGSELQKELGFSTGSPYVSIDGREVEVFTIHPEPGGFMYDAGFRDGMLVVSHSFTKFYKQLYKQRGRTMNVTVVQGGDGPPIEERQTSTISFTIPQKPS